MDILLVGGDWDGAMVRYDGMEELRLPRKLTTQSFDELRESDAIRKRIEVCRYTRRRIEKSSRHIDVLALDVLSDQQVLDLVAQ